MTQQDLQRLAEKITEKIKDDFKIAHLSKNLMDTIIISPTADGFTIEIPAEMYDIGKYYKDRVILYTGQGSYAQEVNVSGGFSKTHIGYVERAINEAIIEWVNENGLRVGVEEI